MDQDIASTLDHALKLNHLLLSTEVKNKLLHFLNLMNKWDRVFNLTAIKTGRDQVYLHLIDSLVIGPYLKGNRLIDVGSGAGLPGIPLALAHPDTSWVLLDKNNKKIRFLTQVIAELDLKNVTVAQDRAEHFHPNERFDSILSRAFGTLTLFCETTEHLLAPRGCFIAMKGKYPKDELNDLPKRFIVTDVQQIAVIGADIERHIVIVKK
jgi:16S rRNA (guanine527-N7)-methyltransferase